MDIIELEIDSNVTEAMAGLKPEALTEAVKLGMDRAMQFVIQDITLERLTGKGPFPVDQHKLGNIEGRGKASVHATDARVEGDDVVATIGSNVVYMRAHEFGFQGEVDVKAHPRKEHKIGPHKNRGRDVPEQKRKAVTVEAHKRKMNIPERAPIRTGLKDHAGIIGEQIGEAIVEMMQKPQK